MEVKKQIGILLKIIEKILLSGEKKHIFIDVSRSQIQYVKYVDGKQFTKINFSELIKESASGEKVSKYRQGSKAGER
jgi:hypothetical protein